MKPEVPLATEAFEDYSLNSMSLSRMEWDVIKKKLKDLNEKDFDMSKREWKELEEKIDK